MTADALADKAAAKVRGWQTKPVTRAAWYEADAALLELAMIDEPRGLAAMERLARAYETWRARNPLLAAEEA